MVRISFIRLLSYLGIRAHAVTQTHGLIHLIFFFFGVCVSHKYMHVYSCTQTETKSGHSSFNLPHSVCVCVCVSTVEGKHSADAAKFPLEGRSREGGKKKNRYSSKILMAE